jgi:outer membrane protein assembly factor BamA
MTYGSSRRPVSDRAFLGRLLVLTCLLTAGLGLAGARAQVAGPELVFAPEVQTDAQLDSWLQEDRTWLAGLPGSERRLEPAPPGTSEADSLAALRGWIMAQAQGDSLPPVRPLASRLRDRWLGRGHLAAAVLPAGEGAPLRLVVTPGPRYSLASIDVGGADFESRDHLLRVWLPRAGEPFDPQRLSRAMSEILLGAGEAGFPFARWVNSDLQVSAAEGTVQVRATLLPGNRSYIGPVTSSLPPGRPARFLARASGLETGDPFRQSDLERASERLLARDLYTSVGTPQVYPTGKVDTVGIHFPVVPRRKVNQLQVVLGLSRRQEDQPSRLSGEVDLRLPNMAGSGRNLGFNWRDDGARKSHLGLDYLEPLAFGTPLDAWFALDSEVESASHTRLRVDNRWQLPVVALWGVELGVGWDRTTYPQGELERSSRVRARGAFLHRRGDRSRSGWFGSFAMETAWRSSVARPADQEDGPTGNQLGEAVTQRIYEVDAGAELWVAPAWSLAGRASFRQLSGSEGVVPLAEQFRFGGAATLRGYREDEFHGTKAAWGSLELRIGPPGGSRLYTFYDLGYFGFSTLAPVAGGSEIQVWKEDWPRGYGLGILARTPGGDISLAVGFPGTVDFDLAKLHVTLLESF